MLKNEKPEHADVYRMDQVSAFLTALPKTFRTLLSDTKRSQPSTVYKKALNFVKNNPQYKLSNKELAKEHKRTVAAVTSAPAQSTIVPGQKNRKKSQDVQSSVSGVTDKGI